MARAVLPVCQVRQIEGQAKQVELQYATVKSRQRGSMAHLPALFLFPSSVYHLHHPRPGRHRHRPRLPPIRRRHHLLRHPSLLHCKRGAIRDAQTQHVRILYGAALFLARDEHIRIY